jgi:hypothetical protein
MNYGEVEENDYKNYRGKCKTECEKLIKEDDTLSLVRGWYLCPFWGEQTHWWCKDSNGNIIDPTVKQFPSKGMGEYIEYIGIVNCSECGKELEEEKAMIMDNGYVFCSYECYGHCVGF